MTNGEMLPQPSAWAAQLAMTATPADFPTDSYSLALWLDRARAPTDRDDRYARDTVAFVQEWMMSGDHEPDQWHRDFAAAIDERVRALADRQPDQRGGEVPWHGDRPGHVCETIAAYWAEWEENRAGRGIYSADELAEDAGEFATGLFDTLAAAPRPAKQTGEGDHGD
ncbi:hypothetical protein [Sphingomonas bacterium]|uniref:hypothetical protein n=1 Tax=Sphingomonas bacterium TaxID=1895847 RepID=UPI0015769328|nr:hypothetical protein [Sphingomonas bacterium]